MFGPRFGLADDHGKDAIASPICFEMVDLVIDICDCAAAGLQMTRNVAELLSVEGTASVRLEQVPRSERSRKTGPVEAGKAQMGLAAG